MDRGVRRREGTRAMKRAPKNGHAKGVVADGLVITHRAEKGDIVLSLAPGVKSIALTPDGARQAAAALLFRAEVVQGGSYPKVVRVDGDTIHLHAITAKLDAYHARQLGMALVGAANEVAANR